MRQLLAALCLATAPFALAQTPAPNLILYNAKVFTGEPGSRFAQAVAITGDHISAVGTTEQVRSLAGDRTKSIDAKGHVIIPGLNVADQEVCTVTAFQVSPNPNASAADLRAAISGSADETPADLWLGGMVSAKTFDDPELTVAALDKAAQGRRVLLFSRDGHAAIINGAALSTLRMNDSHDPAGGWWGHDASGRSTGKAYEYAAYNLKRRLAEETSDDEVVAGVNTLGASAARLGVTTIQVTPCLPRTHFEKIARRASVPVRLRIIPMPGTSSAGRNTDEIRDMGKPAGAHAMMYDNGVAWMLSTQGDKINFSNDEIASILKECAAANQQVVFDINGDRATAALLDALKTADSKDRHVRIDGSIPAPLIASAHDLGVVVVTSPTNAAAKDLLKGGVPLAFASSRSTLSPYTDLRLATSAGLTREEAVQAYTRGAAFAEGAENDKGVLAPGKVADLAVLSQDIFAASSSLPETVSLLTIVGGKVVHDADALR
jgi:predicted amidohydrolase YtcJ